MRRLAENGEMPTASRLRCVAGLASAVAKDGYAVWARRLGLTRNRSTTHRGQGWEVHERDFFARLGHVVIRQSTGAPFDLLVSGRRVDVKTSRLTRCGRYVFSRMKKGVHADIFDLLLLDEDVVLARLIVPSSCARQHTLSVTPRVLDGVGKHAAYLNRTDLL